MLVFSGLLGGVWLFFIAACTSFIAGRFESRGVEFAGLASDVVECISKVAVAGRLRYRWGDQLTPAGKRLKLLPGMVLIGN